ncbi:MAG: imidazole glycerol phosphate synthase subunit HisH [Anaerolineaceae bacterium]|nr:imidazole glycerol phosphate synthase subunit HisH [Anaerolineaceae bacterium]
MPSNEVILIDAGTGNLHSVHNALKSLDCNILVTSNPLEIKAGCHVVLPGVGAFGSFMQGIQQRSLIETILEIVQRADPLLGICVGMQALFEFGKEMGKHKGLGLLPGKVLHFPEFNEEPELKIPHTGWNQLWFEEPASPLFKGIKAGAYTYFNHSYYCLPAESTDVISTTDYGIKVCSAVQRGNLFGVQFHPEKSQRIGQQILRNFINS